jgi:(2R)-3-sulfolactate dehydrogenase (NADP+)
VTARAIILAESWGVRSHGLMRLPFYLDRLGSGGYSTKPMRTVTDTGPLVVLDGAGGLGHWQAWEAAGLAARRAREHGIGLAAVGNSGHCGALGVYTLPALDRSLLSLVFSNGPAVMPAWNGTEPLLSTSPLAAGIPVEPRPAIIDMASTTVARGKIAQFAERGEDLPPGWAFDAAGGPTVDPAEALLGMLAPMGGAKGFALAFLVEALTGGIVGPALSVDVSDMFDADANDVPQRIAHTVITIDPARLDVGAGTGGMDRLRRLAMLTERSGGRVPGSRRRLLRDIADDDPIEIADAVAEDLTGRARLNGVPVPFA